MLVHKSQDTSHIFGIVSFLLSNDEQDYFSFAQISWTRFLSAIIEEYIKFSQIKLGTLDFD